MLVFAHRGASLEAPENTLSAFIKAFQEGVDGVELDVRISADKKLIVFHDRKLDRLTNGRGPVEKYRLEELSRFRVAGNEHIPTLEEVLQLARRYNKMLLIDLKARNAERELIDLIDTYGMTRKVIITSMICHSSRRIKQINPSIKTALLLYKWLRLLKVDPHKFLEILVEGGWRWYLEDPVRLATEYIADYVHIANPMDISRDLVERAHRKGIGVIAGTTDNLEITRKLVEMGVDVLVPNNPRMVIDIIRENKR